MSDILGLEFSPENLDINEVLSLAEDRLTSFKRENSQLKDKLA